MLQECMIKVVELCFFFFFLNISWIEGKGHLLAILVLVPVCLLAQGSSRTTRNFLPT